ncbi:acVLRF1 family peptidyl-tRNA hydrolase [Aquipuribacter hungaricus]|uniref:AcVLRF1 family peptidyl-tRNA hydrolase n=1 Tax=Aquipuribacter hungaricus TaxID=545624 RepID=A0ABV7WEC5_9MICO
MSASRFLEVEPRRLPGWVARYTDARGGAVAVLSTPAGLDLRGEDGSLAHVALLDPPAGRPDGPVDDVGAAADDLAALAAAPRTLLVCLVRRGGWTVGVVRDGSVLSGSSGRRYVQGTTAAGGWSQQRYARRRSGQAGKLADDASSAVARVLDVAAGLPSGAAPDAVVVGGDRALADVVLAPTVAEGWPRLGPLEVGEPRRVDLEAAASRVLALRVTVHDAPG